MKSRTDHHNDGQSDRAEGNGYNAPHGFFEEIFSLGKESDKVFDDNKAYREGWSNADKQDR